MQTWLRDSALYFSSGSVGALAKSGAIWVCANIAFFSGLAPHLTNALYPAGLYARIVWGGVAAFLFLLPLFRSSWVLRGLSWGVVVAMLQVVALPLWDHRGLHFTLMPLLSAFVLGCIWGLVTAATIRLLNA